MHKDTTLTSHAQRGLDIKHAQCLALLCTLRPPIVYKVPCNLTNGIRIRIRIHVVVWRKPNSAGTVKDEKQLPIASITSFDTIISEHFA